MQRSAKIIQNFRSGADGSHNSRLPVVARSVRNMLQYNHGDGIPLVFENLRIVTRDRDKRVDRTWHVSDGIHFANACGASRKDEDAVNNGIEGAARTRAIRLGRDDRHHMLIPPLLSEDHSGANIKFFQPSPQLQRAKPSVMRFTEAEVVQNCQIPISDSNSLSIFKHGPTAGKLAYRISARAFERSLEASKLSGYPLPYWTCSLYEGPNGEKVKLHYCTSKVSSEKVAQLFLGKKVLGFDIEWVPNSCSRDGARKNVSLVQLASEERVALFHVARFSRVESGADLVAPTLKKIMESPDITKVGVAIKGDCTRLRKYLHIRSCGLFELSHLYKLVKYSTGDCKMINKRLVSLAQQVQEHLHLPLFKGDDVRSSDWGQFLNREQVIYAASDPYACLHLYDVLEAKREALVPMPPRPAHVELNLPIIFHGGKALATADETENYDPPSPDGSSSQTDKFSEVDELVDSLSITDIRVEALHMKTSKRQRRVRAVKPASNIDRSSSNSNSRYTSGSYF